MGQLKLVLASQSPRRREILLAAGLTFEVRATSVSEELMPGESAPIYVRRLAQSKARAANHTLDEVVLGADTVVVVDEQILEKPQDEVDAQRMLRLLGGRKHQVMTGICLRYHGGEIVDHAETWVRFADLTESEIHEYTSSGEPLDKAGAYAIQGLASKFIDRIEGCYFNVVGLPISLVYHYLRTIVAR